jgi:hypothetical protein
LVCNDKTLADDHSCRLVDESILVVDVICPHQIVVILQALRVRRYLDLELLELGEIFSSGIFLKDFIEDYMNYYFSLST